MFINYSPQSLLLFLSLSPVDRQPSRTITPGASLAPHFDGKLGITIQDPPRVQKTDTLTVFYVFLLYSVTCLKTCHVTGCFTSLRTSISVSILIPRVTSSRFCSYLLIFITLATHFYMHIQKHTHKSTHVWSAHKRNGDNQAQEPGWEGRKKGVC